MQKPQTLLSIGADAKTVKGESRGYRTAVLYLAPHTLSGRNVCSHATPGCIASCLNLSGRGVFNSVQEARVRRTHFFFERRAEFLTQLYEEIRAHWQSCLHAGMIPVVRLNGTSDLPWESFKIHAGQNIFELCPGVRFYDYTKNTKRAVFSMRKDWPTNYRLVLSRSESNHDACLAHLRAGGNVAMVFAGKRSTPLPDFWSHRDYTAKSAMNDVSVPIIDGDKDDLRFLDPSPCIVGLRAKGPAKKDQSGFVIR